MAMKHWLSGAAASLVLTGCASVAQTPQDAAATFANPARWPEASPGIAAQPVIEARINAILALMSVEEKVGQVVQGDIGSLSVADVVEAGLGSVLAGGNSAPGGKAFASAPEWLAFADAVWEASRAAGPADRPFLPPIFGIDAVHGHNNVIGATLFPHNIGLGAANDPDLIRRIAEVTAREIAVTGIDWTFAPTLAVAQNDRWGRTYESFSENPEIVAAYAAKIVEGLQGPADAPFGPGKIVATAKHFVGDGGTTNGKDQGDATASETDLAAIHGAGYPPAIGAGVQTVMASFSSWQGRKLHGAGDLLTGIVKQHWGFDGFIVGDWNGHGQVPGCSNTNCAPAFLAGVDLFMASDSWKGLRASLLAQVADGTIPMARLDDAVRRILRVKARAGLLDAPKPSARPLAGKFELIGADAHRAVAREAVRKSLVLLKNDNQLLPLAPRQRVLVVGDAADDIARQSGGWTLNWQGTGLTREDFPGATSILQGVRAAVEAAGGVVEHRLDAGFSARPDVAIVVFGETPYAEFQGDLNDLDFADNQALAQMRALKAQGVPVVAVFLSGRPLWVNPELNAADAFVAAWLPGSEGAGLADLLFRTAQGAIAHDFTGRLSFSWPARPDQAVLDRRQAGETPLFAYGYGLSLRDNVRAPIYDEAPARRGPILPTGDIFQRGKPTPPWTLVLRSNGQSQTLAGQAGATADGALALRGLDRFAQEDALRAEWRGSAQIEFASNVPADFQREANGDLDLLIEMRVGVGATGALRLELVCGEDCASARSDLAVLAAQAGQEWFTYRLPLKCFAPGADFSKVSGFRLEAAVPAVIDIAKVEIAATDGVARPCS